ncbi:TetR/AcrR family transcriptional regulator [Peribacillus sp. FSL H8-0477]|uniref:TetR/AcrR family transcriptional regulator n=1 Tax=Peribacillus sp. FSL H8-0477 TaxID=2921388 RepID=UPI0030FC6B59
MTRERKFSTPEIFKATNSLLLRYGYEGFTFSLLAESLDVSRAAIYKYYPNKEELIIDYMVYEMTKMLIDLQKIDQSATFTAQLNELITLIFTYKDIHQILGMVHQFKESSSAVIMEKKKQLEKLHLDMYQYLEGLMVQGKKEKVLRDTLSNDVILGCIFQSIAIPNHRGIPENEWISSIKDVVCYGIFEIK